MKPLHYREALDSPYVVCGFRPRAVRWTFNAMDLERDPKPCAACLAWVTETKKRLAQEPCPAQGCARPQGHEGPHVGELATVESGLLPATKMP